LTCLYNILYNANDKLKFNINLLGEAPKRTQAIALKCRETLKGITGTVGLRLA